MFAATTWTAHLKNLVVRAGDFGAGSPLYRPGDTTQLYHHEVEARDMWVDALTVAARPSWVLDGDPRAVSTQHASLVSSDYTNRGWSRSRLLFCWWSSVQAVCMEGSGGFSFMDRRHHCRKCGGVFRRQVLVSMTLPALCYASEVWVCQPCAEGTKPCGRWDSRPKLNTHERGPRGTAEKLGNKVKDLWRQATR
jgi:hypothetical protein